MAEHDDLKISVRYPAAAKPFHSEESRSQPVGGLKTKVVDAFGLQEGQTNTGIVTFTLYNGKQPLEDLTQTLGAIAGDHKALELKLAQTITQG